MVIPALNEADNIPIVFKEVNEVLKDFDFQNEFMFVNDGSHDFTWVEIKMLCAVNPNVQGINLTMNFGHAVALEVGLNAATGDAIVMMDSNGMRKYGAKLR